MILAYQSSPYQYSLTIYWCCFGALDVDPPGIASAGIDVGCSVAVVVDGPGATGSPDTPGTTWMLPTGAVKNASVTPILAYWPDDCPKPPKKDPTGP